VKDLCFSQDGRSLLVVTGSDSPKDVPFFKDQILLFSLANVLGKSKR
jgi:hypothetical protein